ncbi:MAG TPA: DUF302 domain-containing protein [Tepidisphaeraceae bacterium]|nr:DUF302 domain-containing protein [Tepidisphaeraceae bacterium]
MQERDGIVSLACKYSVDEAAGRLKGILNAKGITLFALVDHSGEAAKAGLTMPPTKLAIFGDPKAGTPIMLAAPTTAIDLPLKILIWADVGGKVWVSYNSADYLRNRHHFSKELESAIAGIAMLAEKVVA